MDATSSYRAATLVQQQPESALADIYANATSLQTSTTGLSDDAMESAQGLGGGVGNRVNNIYIFLMSGSTLTIARIPIVRDRKMLNALGAYKEGVSSKNGAAVVEYYKI